MKKFLLCIIITMMAMPVYAATLRVERDGSADFTVIQDAVNAAASGDTVYIGPGRYNEKEIVSTQGWTEFVRILVHQDELTLIGAGPDETILGPETPWDYSVQGEDNGVVAGPYFGCNTLKIEGIGFENMGRGVNCCQAPSSLLIKNCRFESSYYNLYVCGGSHVEVKSSIFNLATDWGSLISTIGTDYVSLLDCDFIFEEDPLYYGVMVQLNGANDALVQNCTFSEGGYGLRIVSGNGNAQILGCRFTGQNTSGLDLSGYHTTVDNCIFEQQEIAIGVFTLSTDLLFTNSIITDVTDVSFYIYGVDEFEVSNSIIAHGLDFSIRQPEYRENETSTDLHQLLMINNDWGTTDAETIASWISLRDYEALYIPFIGQPVATESISFDGLKALFRGATD